MKHTKFEVFQDKAGEYRWYLRAGNGEIIADSAEGYANKTSALHGIELIQELNPKSVTFEDLTAKAAAATAATAEATAVAGMTVEPAPAEAMTPAAPAAEAPMATEVAMEPAKDTRVRSSVIILVVAVVIIIGIIATGFALRLL
ncbi:MAG: YegP family protein [Thermoplasmata archaeon]